MIMLVLSLRLNNFSVTCIRQPLVAATTSESFRHLTKHICGPFPPPSSPPSLATENYFSPVIFFDSYIQYPGSTSNKVLILDKTQYNTAPSFLQAVESSLENTNNE